MSKYNVWDFWAQYYERLWVQKYSLIPTRNLVIQELENVIKKSNREKNVLLDVGCGTGQLLEEIFQRFSVQSLELKGVDNSPQMIVKAKDKGLSNIEFLTGDALNLPFASKQFSIITCCHSFPYYRDKFQALKEFSRVLRPGGYLLLVQAAENNIYDRLTMKLVKLTTGRATYPSAQAITKLVQETEFKLVDQIRVETQIFMPSIILSILRNGDYS